MKSQKGLFLSLLIILFGVAFTAGTIFLLLDPGVLTALVTVPGWFSLYVVTLWVARMIALIAIWRQRRWGVYALFALVFVEVGMGFSFTGFLSLPQREIISLTALIVIAVIIIAVIWILALRPKWQLFA